ncbi:H-NS family nucleoid-associated regulatory protein [Caballeronia sp. 15715]|uniref:H-NS family nucleoid-associated regulatory protein n=1 Tax=Caballeronia sp. 15715 TaxID=3391030 RepID=UPI0039E23C30
MPTLEQIKDKMKRLQEQAEQLIAKRAQSVLTDIRKLMEEHGLTTADIAAHSTGKKQRGRPAGSKPNTTATRKVASSSVVTGVKPPKYRHPKTGATWTGHGRAPAWIADAKDRSKFLIDGPDGGAVRTAKTATKKTVAVGSAVAHKGQRKGPQPAKYLDPKTGATWSGRGPAPVWLAAAKDRSKFLIVNAATVATEISATSKAGKSQSSTTSGAVAKKKVEMKATSTRGTAEKIVNAKASAN